MAEQEMTDDTAVKEELMLLNLRFEDGEIDEAEFRRQEAPLLARYSEIRAYRRRLAEEQLAGLLSETGDERVAVIETPEELEPPASASATATRSCAAIGTAPSPRWRAEARRCARSATTRQQRRPAAPTS